MFIGPSPFQILWLFSTASSTAAVLGALCVHSPMTGFQPTECQSPSAAATFYHHHRLNHQSNLHILVIIIIRSTTDWVDKCLQRLVLNIITGVLEASRLVVESGCNNNIKTRICAAVKTIYTCTGFTPGSHFIKKVLTLGSVPLMSERQKVPFSLCIFPN